jgi:biopolymer transport protein ExbD
MTAASPKKYLFDVWLTQGKTVYRDVPYEVVTDWLQQGRLLGEDRIRPAKTDEWFTVEKVPAFAAFVPKVSPLRTDTKAETLEPVETGFQWRNPDEEEESDPDMIPLIDVSLVLLIFFMMTSSVAVIVSRIKVPEISDAQVTENVKMIWIGINYISDDMPARYSVNVNSDDGKTAENDLNQEQALKRVREILEKTNDIPEIRLAAHQQLSFELIRDMAVLLEEFKAKGKVRVIKTEVGERKR